MDDYEASTVFIWSIISIIIPILNDERNKRFLCESTLTCQIQFNKLDSITNKTMRISSVL